MNTLTRLKAVEAELNRRDAAAAFVPYTLGIEAFNTEVLGRPPYWSRQAEIAQAVETHRTVLAPCGNGTGKTFLAAGILLHFLYSHRDSLVVFTAPTFASLDNVLGRELRQAHARARQPLPGKLTRSPIKLEVSPGWQAIGYSTTRTERMSGFHAEHVLALIDEGSGIEAPIWEALDSLNPSKLVVFGNPLRSDGPFYERCLRPGPTAAVVQVSSLESPDIDQPRSKWGLADGGWLTQVRNDYGEGSLWWITHVEGRFPDSSVDSVIPLSWLYPCVAAELVRSGPCRTAIDLSEGNGGDRSVVLTRDDNGVLDLEHSTTWSFEQTAAVASRHVAKWGVDPRRVTYDVAGIGSDFANRLAAVGIVGAQPYRGGASSSDVKKYGNRRSAAAWHLRQRLDPGRQAMNARGVPVPQTPFAIQPEFMRLMREELQGLRYTQDSTGRIVLEIKEEFARRLRHSPDFADTLAQSFAFLN